MLEVTVDGGCSHSTRPYVFREGLAAPDYSLGGSGGMPPQKFFEF